MNNKVLFSFTIIFFLISINIFLKCNEEFNEVSKNVVEIPIPDENTLLYQADDLYGWSLYLSTDNFKRHFHLSLGPFDIVPDISLDKQFIVWTRGIPGEKNLRIWKMRYNGENKIPLTSETLNCSNARISPDGNRIIFLSSDEKRNDIFIMDTSGKQIQQITNSSNIPFYENSTFGYPAWSSDGNRIIFCVKKMNTNEEGLAILNLKNNQFVRLFSIDKYLPYNPKWSPKIEELVFEGVIPDYTGPITGPKIFRVNINGNDLVQLTETESFEGRSPDWSSDGERIVYARKDSINGFLNIWTMNRDGSNKKKIIEIIGCHATEPNW